MRSKEIVYSLARLIFVNLKNRERHERRNEAKKLVSICRTQQYCQLRKENNGEVEGDRLASFYLKCSQMVGQLTAMHKQNI